MAEFSFSLAHWKGHTELYAHTENIDKSFIRYTDIGNNK